MDSEFNSHQVKAQTPDLFGILKVLATSISVVITFVGSLAGLVALARQQSWLVGSVLFTLALATAGYIYLSKRNTADQQGVPGASPFYPGWARRIALGVMIALPSAAVTLFVGWQWWLGVPATSTIILLGKFTDNASADNDTQGLTNEIYEQLNGKIEDVASLGKDHPRAGVKVAILGYPISLTADNKSVAQLGRSAKASVVVWGDYNVGRDDIRLYPHVQILRTFQLERAGSLSSKKRLGAIILRKDRAGASDAATREFAYITAAVVGLACYNVSDYKCAKTALSEAINNVRMRNPEKHALNADEPHAVDLDVLYYYRSNANGKLGQTKPSLDDINMAVRLNPHNVLDLTNQGAINYNLGNTKEALKSYVRAMTLSSNDEAKDPILLLDLAVLEEYSLGKYADAEKTYENLENLPVSVHRPWDWRIKGEAAMYLRHFDTARSALHEAVFRFPDQSSVHVEYADCLVEMGSFQQALEEYTRAFRLDPTNDGILYNRVLAYEALGNDAAAKGDLQRIVAPAPPETQETAADHLNRGRAQQLLGNLRSAAGEYAAAIKMNPNSTTALGASAKLKFDRRDYKEAASELDRALQLRPFDELERVKLGDFLRAAGQRDKADPQYQKVLTSPIGGFDGDLSRAEALFRLSRFNETIAELNQAIAINPYSGEAYIFRGRAELEMHSDQSAINDETKAVRLLPDDARVYEVRSAAYRDAGRLADARADHDEVANLNRPIGHRSNYGWVQKSIRALKAR